MAVALAAPGPATALIMWAEVTVTLICVLLRFYTRTRILRFQGWDDGLMYISMLLFMLYAVFQTIAVAHGLGRCDRALSAPKFASAKKYEFIGHACNICAVATAKSSVACVLLRLSSSRGQRCALWFCISSTCIICLLCIILMFAQCSPLETVFQPAAGQNCFIDFTVAAVFTGAYTALMDIILAVAPWVMFSQALLHRKERLIALTGLSLGILAGICGIARAVELRRVSATTDYLSDTVPIVLLSSTEQCVCMCCAILPTLRPFMRGEGRSTQHNVDHGTP
ncbi:hypothetical protein B0J12DRAFT_585756 [Macrophomina phaseolina]|uniref:Rhodopsin domain-containing protein n=1 Tax=Macrophomina phaseolina TaxID=35725 RepID=A0ABQ8FSC1_9PEZI|nr:hypothetical protein B0J12DRAFT_585756 [Macrophomina phaseolina]